MTYDDWKLASPKEYEEDAPPAQPQPITKKRRGGIPAGGYCPGCGAVTDGRHLDHALLPMKEDEDVKF